MPRVKFPGRGLAGGDGRKALGKVPGGGATGRRRGGPRRHDGRVETTPCMKYQVQGLVRVGRSGRRSSTQLCTVTRRKGELCV